MEPGKNEDLLRRVLEDWGLIEETRFGVPLASLTSLGIGGTAPALVETSDPGRLAGLLSSLKEQSIPWRVLGGGTNLLVDEAGVPGVVLRLLPSPPEREGKTGLRIGAGTSLARATAAAAGFGLGGMEFCAGIPGTVGGAVVMNAGTAERWVSSILESVTVLVPGQGSQQLPPAECGFSYRCSRFRRENLVILSAGFRLFSSSAQEVQASMRTQQDRRQQRLPGPGRSAGCWFRNPPGDSAGRLIEAAGLKGTARGGAAVSTAHANFIIAGPGTSSVEIRELAGLIRERVKEYSGISLEEEVVFWGEEPGKKEF